MGYLTAVLLLVSFGCRRHGEERWVGMERGAVSCDYDSRRQQTCVGMGRVYTCIRDQGHWVWNCAEWHGARATVEAAP